MTRIESWELSQHPFSEVKPTPANMPADQLIAEITSLELRLPELNLEERDRLLLLQGELQQREQVRDLPQSPRRR